MSVLEDQRERTLTIGWGHADLTPQGPVLIAGQFHARVSEGVRDPLTATALALENHSGEQAILVGCDLVSIPDGLRDGVRDRLANVDGLDPLKVILNATHTHTGPEIRSDRAGIGGTVGADDCGVALDAMSGRECMEYVADRIAGAVRHAWENRKPGGVSHALSHAVIGHNRRWTNRDGVSRMYGDTNDPGFSHIEGCEDHAVNLLFTWDREERLTGVAVNLACSAQVSEQDCRISADYWHEARQEIRRRLGDSLFILPQCSAAGDQSPHHIIRKAAELRMLDLKGRTEREEIAARLADAIDDVLPYMDKVVAWDPLLRHQVETLGLTRRELTQADVESALVEAANWRAQYETLRDELERHPERRRKPRWYFDVTRAFRRAQWYEGVARRFEEQKRVPRLPVEIHVVRLGDIVFATNPFEYYLDFGMRIVARSPAEQTFVVQLAGGGSYVPTRRSIAGGGYGSVPASTPIGPKGGEELADRTSEIIAALWSNTESAP